MKKPQLNDFQVLHQSKIKFITTPSNKADTIVKNRHNYLQLFIMHIPNNQIETCTSTRAYASGAILKKLISTGN